MPKRHDYHKLVIGRAEMLSFPEVEINDVPAKVDTGAYRNAVHASDIQAKNGTLTANLLAGHPAVGTLSFPVATKEFSEVFITNSFGHREKRYEIKLKVKLGPKVFVTPFSLASRENNTYPILLGRKLLNRRFIVDTDKTGINRSELKSKYAIEFPGDEEEGRDE